MGHRGEVLAPALGLFGEGLEKGGGPVRAGQGQLTDGPGRGPEGFLDVRGRGNRVGVGKMLPRPRVD